MMTKNQSNERDQLEMLTIDQLVLRRSFGTMPFVNNLKDPTRGSFL
ncbi:hypothetical protein [Pseudoneobacillus sp. C159]